MPSLQSPSAREVLIESLGRLSEDEKRELHGPGWASFARRKVRSLREAKKWVIALGVTMGLFSVAVPTTAFYHYYEASETFSVLEFLGIIGGACTFAALQMGWAAFIYMNWRHQLQCYEALMALGDAPASASEEAPTPASQEE